MFDRILVIGATGLLGRPVVNHLTEGGHTVRILTRSAEKAHEMFGGAETHLLAAIGVFARVGAAATVVPGLGERAISLRTRLNDEEVARLAAGVRSVEARLAVRRASRDSARRDLESWTNEQLSDLGAVAGRRLVG